MDDGTPEWLTHVAPAYGEPGPEQFAGIGDWYRQAREAEAERDARLSSGADNDATDDE